MYAAFFGLSDKPFSITPDPHYLFLSARHQEALAHLLYGTGEDGGFVELTGEVGTGKTTLIRTLLERGTEGLDVALCLNPRLTVEEFVASVCDELGVEYPLHTTTLKPMIDALNKHLLAAHSAGRRTVLIIDEAQNLSREVLEQVRLLTNLETHRHKLLRIMLVGQPELKDMLNRKDLRQLAQRITARYHLTPLNRAETAAYIMHRIEVANGDPKLFTSGALSAAHKLTDGVPRLINVICDRALLGAYSIGLKRVDAKTLRKAAAESLYGDYSAKRRRWPMVAAAVVGTAGLGMLGWQYLPRYSGFVPSVAVATPEAPPLVVAASIEPSPSPSLIEVTPIANSPDVIINAAPKALPAPEALPEAIVEVPVPQVEPVVDTTPVVPATPSPTPTTAPEPTLQTRLAQRDTSGAAFGRLLVSWGESSALPYDLPPCSYVESRALECEKGVASWDQLQRFNRPVLLDLRSPDGSAHKVILRAVADGQVTLDLAGQMVVVDQDELLSIWNGEYLFLWRRFETRPPISPGQRGPEVSWLRQRLALADGESGGGENAEYFDEDLRQRVSRFQISRGLDADGLVGPQTMKHLSHLAPMPGTPVLTAASEG